MIFRAWFARLFRKAFTKPPDIPLYKWAERWVYILRKHGAEEGYYNSAKTPWTRWPQELMRLKWRLRNGRRVRVRRLVIKKCTQSGFTEGVLNYLRWCAKYCPTNFLYAINTKEEAENIRARLVDTLERLGEEILPADTDLKDLARFVLKLREMTGWFTGSFSGGSFANKFAPTTVNDEYDDHAILPDQASTGDLSKERGKTADDEELNILLGKPQNADGPICREHAKGDKFAWWVPCPHCGTHQPLVWERVKFDHCRDDGGRWDLERLLTETYYLCASVHACRIADTEANKRWMNARGRWVCYALGDPEQVSLEMSDLYSMWASSTLGIIAKEFVLATADAKRGNLQPLQIWKNGRMGEGIETRAEKFTVKDVEACKGEYVRGIIPRKGLILIGGFDVGLYVNTAWTVLAIDPLTFEAFVIDWGDAGGPADMETLLTQRRWLCPATGFYQSIAFLFPDCRYRRDEVFAVSKKFPARIRPTLGIKSQVSVRSVYWTHVPGEEADFGVITFIDQDAKFHLYLHRIKHRHPPRLWVPSDADEAFMGELSNEQLIKDALTGDLSFSTKPKGPNHKGDTVKIALLGFDYTVDGPRTRAANASGAPAPTIDLHALTT